MQEKLPSLIEHPQSAISCALLADLAVFLHPKMSVRLTLFLFLATMVLADSKVVNYSESLDQLAEKYMRLVNSVLQQIMPLMLKATSEAGISADCTHTLFQVILGFRRLDEWAVALIDASGKIQSGVLDGTASHFGEYDECLAVTAKRVDFSGKLEESFRGQYCLVEVWPPRLLSPKSTNHFNLKNNSIFQELSRSTTIFRKLIHLQRDVRLNSRFGLCVPSKCSVEDVRKMVEMAADLLELKTNVLNCDTRESFIWKSEHVGIVTILGILLFLTIIGTAVDIITRKKLFGVKASDKNPDFCTNLWTSFSARTSMKFLMKRESVYHHLSFLHGIRFLTMCWIVFAHTYFFPYTAFFYQFKRLMNVVEFQKQVIFRALTNPSPAIDSLFVISGFLISYKSGLRMTVSKKGLGLWSSFIRKVLQATPPLILTIFLFLLLPLVGNGPQWNDLVNRNIDVCRYNWWKSLLFIQNFWKFRDNCMMHTWFLSLSIQYYFLSIIFLWLLYKKYKFGIFVNVGVIVISSLVLGYFNVSNKFPPSLQVIDISLWEDIMNKDYLRTYAHIGPFCIGLLAGCLIVRVRKFRIKPVFQWIGWILCSSFMLAIVISLYELDETRPNYIPLIAAYAALNRPLWAAGIAWICITCATGHAKTLSRFLSWRAFIQLDRLSLFLYLLHPLVIFYYTGRSRERAYLGHPEMITRFISNMVISLLVSFLCFIGFHAPFHYLDLMLFEKHTSQKEAEIENEIPDPEKIINIYRSTTGSLISEVPSRQRDSVPPRRRKISTVSFKSQPIILNQDENVDGCSAAGPSSPVTAQPAVQDAPRNLLPRMDSVQEEEVFHEDAATSLDLNAESTSVQISSEDRSNQTELKSIIVGTESSTA